MTLHFSAWSTAASPFVLGAAAIASQAPLEHTGPLTWGGLVLLIVSTLTVATKSLIPAVISLIRRQEGTAAGSDRVEGGDFREMLLRLTNLAEANDKGMERVAKDREEMRDVLRSLDMHKVRQLEQTDKLIVLVDKTETATLANQKLLNLMMDAGIIDAIKVRLVEGRRKPKQRGK
jgi:hypothetical protein